MALVYSLLGLVTAAFVPTSLAQPYPYRPQNVEMDLVFPWNDTFAPRDKFPLLWGLQNANSAWVMGMKFSWELQQLDQPEADPEQGIFPSPDFRGGSVPATFTDGPNAPTDPYFLYYYPEHLSNLTEGRWKLSWKFGFHITCANNGLNTSDHFQHQKPQELIFQVDGSGKTVDILALSNNSCPDQSTTFRIVDWQVPFISSDRCPILSPTAPTPQPCALTFNESLIEEMNAGAETGCSSATVTEFHIRCKTSKASHLMVQGPGPGLLTFCLVVFSLLL